jgi:hypothetical protein
LTGAQASSLAVSAKREKPGFNTQVE